jgi:glycosyltransferase involved in cell wall biosynthesis
VRAVLPDDIAGSVHTVPHLSKGLWPRLANTVFAARQRHTDVVHVTGDIHYATYLLRRSRTVLTVLDCGHQRRGAIGSWLYDALWFRLPARRVAIITVSSDVVYRDLRRLVTFPARNIRMVPISIDGDFRRSPRRFDDEYPEVLQIGTGPNKNVPRLVRALSGLSCRLHLVGPLTPELRNEIVQAGVVYRHSVNLSQDEIVQAYQQCDLVALCSTFEGFGMPIVEAQATGRPVVTSALSSMPEVAGDAACLVDPYDVESIRQGIRRIIADAAYRSELVERGYHNARRYSPEPIAALYAEIYRELVV